MDKILETAAIQVPNMVILAFVVMAFFKHLAKKDKEFGDAFSKRDGIIQEMHHENMAAREQSRLVIEKNTVAATQNTEAMKTMTTVMRDFIHRTHSRQ